MASCNDQFISITLDNEELWAEFAEHTPEMMVTRPGRKLFPKLELNISGLNKNENYGIRIELRRADKLKYHFSDYHRKWEENGEEAEFNANVGSVIYHKDGYVQSGKDWMKRTVEFTDFKITNDTDAEGEALAFVQSLHKYTPIVHIVDQIGRLLRSQPLDIATFIVVTAYQNPEIKVLKVKRNPYAVAQQKKPRHAILLSASNARKRGATVPADFYQNPPPPNPAYRNHEYSNPSYSNRVAVLQPAPAPTPPSSYPFHGAGSSSFDQQLMPPPASYFPNQQPPACMMQVSTPQAAFNQGITPQAKPTPPPNSYLGAGPSCQVTPQQAAFYKTPPPPIQCPLNTESFGSPLQIESTKAVPAQTPPPNPYFCAGPSSQTPPSPTQSVVSTGSIDHTFPPQATPPQATHPQIAPPPATLVFGTGPSIQMEFRHQTPPIPSPYTHVWPSVATPYLGAGPSNQVSPPQPTFSHWQPPACALQLKPDTSSSAQAPPAQAPCSSQNPPPYSPYASHNSFPQTSSFTQNPPPQKSCAFKNLSPQTSSYTQNPPPQAHFSFQTPPSQIACAFQTPPPFSHYNPAQFPAAYPTQIPGYQAPSPYHQACQRGPAYQASNPASVSYPDQSVPQFPDVGSDSDSETFFPRNM